jgi:hypothetical protein
LIQEGIVDDAHDRNAFDSQSDRGSYHWESMYLLS